VSSSLRSAQGVGAVLAYNASSLAEVTAAAVDAGQGGGYGAALAIVRREVLNNARWVRACVHGEDERARYLSCAVQCSATRAAQDGHYYHTASLPARLLRYLAMCHVVLLGGWKRGALMTLAAYCMGLAAAAGEQGSGRLLPRLPACYVSGPLEVLQLRGPPGCVGGGWAPQLCGY
jgi:hypothetical protein